MASDLLQTSEVLGVDPLRIKGDTEPTPPVYRDVELRSIVSTSPAPPSPPTEHSSGQEDHQRTLLFGESAHRFSGLAVLA
jgi:hypothetical protein